MDVARILIVDDEPGVRLVMERTLRQDGYQLETACNGLEALEKLKKNNYDLLLVDLNMKPVNGIQMLNHIKKSGKESVVIILTAHSSIESAVEALRLGAFDYLFKPASPETIRQRVSEGLKQHHQNLRRQRLLAQIEQLRLTIEELDAERQTIATNPPSDRFLRSGDLVIDRHHRVATLAGTLLDLTTTEFNLLAYLVESTPKPVTPRQLTNAALNYDSEDSEASEIIKWHIYHLRRKIESEPKKPRHIITVRYQGYLWRG